MRILLLIILLTACNTQASEIEYVTDHGVIGNGLIDDTINLQVALTYCSMNQVTCVIPRGKKVLITGPIYIWNDSGLVGEHGAEIHINFIDLAERFVINVGIIGRQQPRPPFTGSIKNITFRVINGPTDKWLPDRTPIAGRIIQFWRAKHATIKNNVFEMGPYFYGATGSQNNQFWLRGHAIKHNLTIKGNEIYQDATNHGQECIGIGPAEDITISENKCVGSGDDLIGAHFVNGLTIKNNSLFGVDGRIYMSDSTDIIVKGNHVERIASTLDGLWYKGNTLLYLGYEDGARQHTRPSNATIKDNVLVLPELAIDAGAVIAIRGASDVLIKGNIIRNDSQAVTSKGVWIAPWRDITTSNIEYEKYYIENISIINNKFSGENPLEVFQTDQCKGYKGFVYILDNLGSINRLSCSLVVNEHVNQSILF